jgi:hypothetical protein
VDEFVLHEYVPAAMQEIDPQTSSPFIADDGRAER